MIATNIATSTNVSGHATVSPLPARGERVRVRGGLMGMSVRGRNLRCRLKLPVAVRWGLKMSATEVGMRTNSLQGNA